MMQLPDYPILAKAIDRYVQNPALTEQAFGPPNGISYINRFYRLKYNPLKTISKERQAWCEPNVNEVWANKILQKHHREAAIGRLEQKAPVNPILKNGAYSYLLLSYQYWPYPEMESLPECKSVLKQTHVESSFLADLPPNKRDISIDSIVGLHEFPVPRFEQSTDSLQALLAPPAPNPSEINLPSIEDLLPPVDPIPDEQQQPNPGEVSERSHSGNYDANSKIPEESAEELEEVAPLADLPPVGVGRRVSIRYSTTSLGKADDAFTKDAPGSESLPAVSPLKRSLWRSSLKEEGLLEGTPIKRRVERPRLRVSFGSNILQEKDYMTTKRTFKIPPRGRISAHHIFGSHLAKSDTKQSPKTPISLAGRPSLELAVPCYTRTFADLTRGTMVDEISPLLPEDLESRTFDMLEPENISRSVSKRALPDSRVSVKFTSRDSVESGDLKSRNSLFFVKNHSRKGFLIK
jgi:hypothetical protein